MVQIAVLWGHAGCLLSRVERCPLLGRSKYTISIGRAIGGMEFGGYLVQIAVLWRHAGCLLSGVERCPLLGGSKCTISIGRAIGGMEFVHCTEVVCLIRGFTVYIILFCHGIEIASS